MIALLQTRIGTMQIAQSVSTYCKLSCVCVTLFFSLIYENIEWLNVYGAHRTLDSQILNCCFVILKYMSKY